MSVCANVRMSKIMCMPKKVAVPRYVMYANCRTLLQEAIQTLLFLTFSFQNFIYIY